MVVRICTIVGDMFLLKAVVKRKSVLKLAVLFCKKIVWLNIFSKGNVCKIINLT